MAQARLRAIASRVAGVIWKMSPIHVAFLPLMFAHWVGWQITFGYTLCLVGFILSLRLLQGKLFLNNMMVGILLLSIFFLLVNSIHMIGDSNTNLVYSNLNQYLTLFFLVMVLYFSKPWKMDELYKMARVIFWIAFYSIALEFLAVNFLGIPKESMPAVRYSPSYFGDFMGWHRPFGLTGQSSANGGILLLSYLLLVEFRIADAKSVLALILGAALTISGQAMLSIALVLGLLQLSKIENRLLKVALMPLFAAVLLWLLNLDLFPKLSLDYLAYVLLEKAYFSETIGVLNAWQLLFGTLGLVEPEGGYSTEVFMIESIRLFGVVFSAAFWMFVWMLVKKSKIKFVWFIGCVVSSLHYPTVLYIEAQLPLALLYLSASLQGSKFAKTNVPFQLENVARGSTLHRRAI